jgi:predicted acetyltransferase
VSNNENVVISSNKELVEPFVWEFERLWEENMQEVEAMLDRGDW